MITLWQQRSAASELELREGMYRTVGDTWQRLKRALEDYIDGCGAPPSFGNPHIACAASYTFEFEARIAAERPLLAADVALLIIKVSVGTPYSALVFAHQYSTPSKRMKDS